MTMFLIKLVTRLGECTANKAVAKAFN